MKLNDYRKKKDLQGRTTEFRKTPHPAPTVKKLDGKPVPPAKLPAQRNLKSNGYVKDRSSDMWYYNRHIYGSQLTAQRPSEEQAKQFKLRQKYGNLLKDWFTNEEIWHV